MNTLEELEVVVQHTPKWVMELAEEVGREVEKLVKAAPQPPASISNKFDLLQAVEARRHFETLRNGESEYILPGDREDVFLGDKRNSTKVETFAQLKKLCNEITHMYVVENYVGAGVLVEARIPSNYVGKIGEVRLKDLDDQQLTEVRFKREDDNLIMCMGGKPFFTDESFGRLTSKQVIEAYNHIQFQVDDSGMLINWRVGPDPSAVPVEDLEHEYVTIK